MTACHVLGGAFATAVQGCLFIVTIAVLTFKFKKEQTDKGTKARTVYQFCFDSSKNMAGSAWTHVANLGCAMVLGGREGASGDSSDACAWYWIEIMLDTTVGVAVEYFLLEGLIRLCSASGLSIDVASGKYYDGAFAVKNIKWQSYFTQLAAWLTVVTGMKFVMVFAMLQLASPLQAVAQLLLSPFEASAQAKLFMVMVLTPGVMNSVQFWLVDNIFCHAKEEAARPQMRAREASEDPDRVGAPYEEFPMTGKWCAERRFGDGRAYVRLLVCRVECTGGWRLALR